MNFGYLPGVMSDIFGSWEQVDFDRRIFDSIVARYKSLPYDQYVDCLVEAYLIKCEEMDDPRLSLWIWDAIFVRYYDLAQTDEDGTKLNYHTDHDKVMARLSDEDKMVMDYMDMLKDNITDWYHYCEGCNDEDEEDDPHLIRMRKLEDEGDFYGYEDAARYVISKYPDVYYRSKK